MTSNTMESAGVDHLSAAQHGSVKIVSQGDRTLDGPVKSGHLSLNASSSFLEGAVRSDCLTLNASPHISMPQFPRL